MYLLTQVIIARPFIWSGTYKQLCPDLIPNDGKHTILLVVKFGGDVWNTKHGKLFK